MSTELFIIMGVFAFVPLMYLISMLWYFFISKNRGVYLIELVVLLGGISVMVILLSNGYTADMGNALASIFGAFFMIPVVVGAMVAAILVKITIVLLNRNQ